MTIRGIREKRNANIPEQSTPVSRHRTARGAQRLRDLISVAGELFLEHGFDDVSVEDLISRVGGSRSNIYCHFGGKQGLFREAMTRLCAEIAKPLEQLNIQGDPGEVLPFLGRHLLKSALSPRTLALHRLLVNEGRRFPEVAHAMWEVSYDKVVGILAQWIAQQQERADQGLSGAVPAKALAEQFVSMVASTAKLRAASGLMSAPLADTEVEEIVSNAVSTFLYGASRPPPSAASGKSRQRAGNLV